MVVTSLTRIVSTSISLDLCWAGLVHFEADSPYVPDHLCTA